MDKKENTAYTGYNKQLKETAQKLRREMTPQERHLWYDFLKNYPIRFNRQRPIAKYIADFYCSQAKLVIEIDGSQHYSDEGKMDDENRTYVLNQYGLEVIRFSNRDINTNFEGVCIVIDQKVKERIKFDETEE
ncbi:MAG: endonuclease domain-containing protein [Clostridia bacterium]|nr:endonuclease domain-containing protein [Clostridia bacterium]